MLKQTEGSRAVAEAIALCRPQVICAYPITPQTHIVEGLPVRGYVLLNSTHSIDELGLGGFARGPRHYRLHMLPATELAVKHVGRAVPNAALLGGFAAITGKIALASVVAAIRQKFPSKIAEKNVAAATEAFDLAAQTLDTSDA